MQLTNLMEEKMKRTWISLLFVVFSLAAAAEARADRDGRVLRADGDTVRLEARHLRAHLSAGSVA